MRLITLEPPWPRPPSDSPSVMLFVIMKIARVVFHAARNGACKNNTSSPHATQMVAPWHCTEAMSFGAWKHATGAAASSCSPPLGGSAVMSSMSSLVVRTCRLVPSLSLAKANSETATWRTCVPDARSQKRTCATHPSQPCSAIPGTDAHMPPGPSLVPGPRTVLSPQEPSPPMRSVLPLMACAPSSLNSTCVTQPECPVRVHICQRAPASDHLRHNTRGKLRWWEPSRILKYRVHHARVPRHRALRVHDDACPSLFVVQMQPSLLLSQFDVQTPTPSRSRMGLVGRAGTSGLYRELLVLYRAGGVQCTSRH
ncbi:hypothetical protein T484DRAFT_2594692 [Baffinella frigidus]|nr:hypothetical protein T484DRAFT_2594692 [Cryptophyta sp. CCMP2293]